MKQKIGARFEVPTEFDYLAPLIDLHKEVHQLDTEKKFYVIDPNRTKYKDFCGKI